MNQKDLLNNLFYVAYHSDDLTINVRTFLRENFPTMMHNRHMQAMFHFLDVLSQNGRDNENPFILGMLCEAWRQFLKELS